MSKCITVQEAFEDDEKREEFIGQMNIRFNLIKNLMDSLNVDINSEDKIMRAKTIFCAFKLIICLDQFVEEMHEAVNEMKSWEKEIEEIQCSKLN